MNEKPTPAPVGPVGPVPQVIDDSGRPLVGPELEAVLKTVTGMAQLAQLARIRKSLEREHVEGRAIEVNLSCTEHVQLYEPLIPWATASFHNKGPDTAHIAVNHPGLYFNLENGDTQSEDLTKADQRIEQIYFWSDPGNTAIVRAQGKF